MARIIFNEFVAADGGNVLVFKDEVRTSGTSRAIYVKEPYSVRDVLFITNDLTGFSDPTAGTVFIDDLSVFSPPVISFGPLSDLTRISFQRQSSMFLLLIARYLAMQRAKVARKQITVHKFASVASTPNPILGNYIIFRDGLSIFTPEIVAIFDEGLFL
jgi:hypothetical protein